jgi:hypothetical protein
MNDIIYRANHEATYNMLIKLYISASTTEITQLDVKQVKSGSEARLRSTQPQFCLVIAQRNDLHTAKYLWHFLCLFSMKLNGFRKPRETIVDPRLMAVCYQKGLAYYSTVPNCELGTFRGQNRGDQSRGGGYQLVWRMGLRTLLEAVMLKSIAKKAWVRVAPPPFYEAVCHHCWEQR